MRKVDWGTMLSPRAEYVQVCPGCILLGHHEKLGVDWYLCQSVAGDGLTILGRYNDKPEGYWSMPSDVLYSAYKRGHRGTELMKCATILLLKLVLAISGPAVPGWPRAGGYCSPRC